MTTQQYHNHETEYSEEIARQVQSDLFALQDCGYRDFQSRLIPTLPSDAVIGVRMPALRRYASSFAKRPEAAVFLRSLPHRYYEENNLHAALIEKMSGYEETIGALEVFFPYLDNWATCDMLAPKCFAKHRAQLYGKIREWIAGGRTYEVRFAVGMLMRHYLEESFSQESMRLVEEIRSEEYYVNMMVAWYFATALAKQYEAAVGVLRSASLPVWTHNKTIQKAVESYRITQEQKAYLRTLRR
ncbi:MAG: DNA alkylation repair protein [Eubacteriales bacterium]|nr:DNA alkylation repair protein [Eubacteriales bacterium]